MGAPIQRVGGIECCIGQCPHVAALAGQAFGWGVAAEAVQSAPGRQSRSVIAEPSGHHWTSGNDAANASGTSADARRRAEPMRIPVIIDIRPT
jgi:hypothetical protein